MYPGVYEWYQDRINAVRNYSFKTALEMVGMIIRCASNDRMLTWVEFNSIIKQCDELHNKLLEGDFNDGWHEQ